MNDSGAGTLAPSLVITAGPDHRLLVAKQWLPPPPAELFEFFADARNLERITPPFLRFSVLSVSTPTVGEGTRIAYRLRLRGVPLRWESVIENWEPPHRFTDRQVRGPYRLWVHQHELIPDKSGTLLVDRVRFRLPLPGLPGALIAPLVERDLKRIFGYRQQVIGTLFTR